jgi:MFS family permease
VRVVAAVSLVLLGCVAALIAWGPLQNLFGYRDSPVSTYLLFGLPWAVLAVAAFAAAWWLIMR